jgi:2-hydroxychromene-2-carboxylate isomerase
MAASKVGGTVQCFYDVVSPWAYLGFEVVTRYARQYPALVNVELCPFFLGGVMQSTGWLVGVVVFGCPCRKRPCTSVCNRLCVRMYVRVCVHIYVNVCVPICASMLATDALT